MKTESGGVDYFGLWCRLKTILKAAHGLDLRINPGGERAGLFKELLDGMESLERESAADNPAEGE